MKVLVDSDFLFGFFVPSDPHYLRAKKFWLEVVEKGIEVLVLNLVIQETATVLSYKINQEVAVNFVEKLPRLELRTLRVNEEMEDAAWKIFLKHKKKGTSFIDCMNLAVVEKYKLDGILSFDMFYPKSVRIS